MQKLLRNATISITVAPHIHDGVAPITGFSLERFEALKSMHDEHFWFAGRRSLIDQALRDLQIDNRKIAIDLGCGPGAHLHMWQGYAHHVIGVDKFVEHAERFESSDTISLVAADVLALPFEDGSVDLILALDVFEHVPDVAAVAEAARILKPGAVLIVTVPAFQWLWSIRDKDAGHRRRYSLAEISDIVEDAGLSVQHARYYQFFLFPLVVVSRVIGRLSRGVRNVEDAPPRLTNSILRTVNLFEARLGARGITMPFGSSVLIAARKPFADVE